MNALTRLAICLLLCAAPAAAQPATPAPITLESLLKEMVNRDAIARFPDPPYTCKQFSSYDRASTTPADPKTWFANGDVNQYLRVEDVPLRDGATRKEWVMAEMEGPGAVVRIWSANPKGNLRIYIDGNSTPVIEAPMADYLGGKWQVNPPLSRESSRGWNAFLPIPYAEQCKITSDSNGFYYQINYRTYPAGTPVESADPGLTLRQLDIIGATNEALSDKTHSADPASAPFSRELTLAPGQSHTIPLPAGPHSVRMLALNLRDAYEDQSARSTVVSLTFDGEQTAWAPLAAFLAGGAGINQSADWWRNIGTSGGMVFWPMPYQKSGSISLANLGSKTVRVGVAGTTAPWSWDARSMHFHATWHAEYPIHALGGRGTKDWNYVDITGKGVYVGDSLAVMNPVAEWWGEGDEKIYVDGEAFPSHFGTGTEDYYGYAWCCNVPFEHPFHSQPRCDGYKHGNNWGHTTVNRFRSLDGIPFTKSLKFDMEVWHWKECDIAYAATTFFYALPGATTNREPQPDEASKPIPQPPPLPPPFKMEGAIECEDLKVLAKSAGLTVLPQDMRSFAARTWSGESHLWVQGRKPGDFVELAIPTGPGPEGKKPVNITLHATRSWDYGIIRFSVNGTPVPTDHDLFSGQQGKVLATGPINLGTFTPINGKLTLRAEVVGGNEKAAGTKSFFGLDCVMLAPAGPAR